MSKIRGIVEGTFEDYDKFSGFIHRLCEAVDRDEPGTLAFEFFVDQQSSRFLAYEIYADEAAFNAHDHTLSRFSNELQQVMTVDRVTSLGRIADPQIKQSLQHMGTVEMEPLTGVVR